MTPEESRAWRPDIEGASTDILPFYAEWIPRIPKGGRFVEVGVFRGRSLAFAASLRSDIELWAVDPWQPVAPTKNYAPLHASMTDFLATFPDVERLRILRAPSPAALRVFEDASVDMVFVDGDHAPDAVAADVTEALRIVKPGGLISGHDYGVNNGIPAALERVLGRVEVAPWDTAEDGWFTGHSLCWWKQR